MENLKKAIELLKTRKEFLKKRFGVIRLGIFGSFAKCKASQKSDIDIYTKGGLESIRIPYVRRSIERSITYV
ncbi:MAG: nucleotidyltransferase domain-containing protein [Synergistetes bacterium]|nr:nucleotidyltransferase domain-containing protein [Synergistota bacterium]